MSLPGPHPEDAVIGQIDALVDAQMASRPGDDNTDYYPKCSCGHDWHGVKCAYCGCPGAYATDVELYKFHRPQRSPRRDVDFRVDCGTEDFEPVWRANQNQDGAAYTIDALMAMRSAIWERQRSVMVRFGFAVEQIQRFEFAVEQIHTTLQQLLWPPHE